MPDDELWIDQQGDGQWPDEDHLDEKDDEEHDDPGDEDDESTPTVPCPECGTEVYEEAVQCPVCGSYVTHPNSVWSGRPGWWILLGLLGVVAAIVVLAGLAAW